LAIHTATSSFNISGLPLLECGVGYIIIHEAGNISRSMRPRKQVRI
jgi:hypothetical protein